MADEEEFKIKGAAQKHDASEGLSTSPGQASEKDSTPSDQAEAEEVSEIEDENASGVQEENNDLSDEQKYRWYKCAADASYGENVFYYIHADTQESSWDEPKEPFWVFDPVTGKAASIGLQFPNQATRTREDVLGLDPAAKWGGYNPKIHGNYDPNADYARFHEARRVEEEASLHPFDTSMAPALPTAAAAAYQSALRTNRATGSVLAPDAAGPERHSDAAKSGRQMNAFFDVDAAANAHDGRSLKEERKAQKLTKDQVKAFNAARREKKQKKRMAFLKS